MGLSEVIFLFLMCVAPSMQITSTYSYECEENGTITLFGLSASSTVQLVSVNGASATSGCNETKHQVNGKVFIPYTCVPDIKIDRTVIINIFDPHADTAATPKPIPQQPGRRRKRSDLFHYQHLKTFTCGALANKGVVQQVVQQVQVPDTGPLQNKSNAVGNVEMRFKAEARQTNELPDISSVYLGDRFYMYLKYTGTQDYTISPQNCTAYDGDWSVPNYSVNHVTLWTYETCVSEESMIYHLMHNFKKIDGKTVYAEMYGFHFDKDKDITLACDVLICSTVNPDSKCTVQLTANHCADGWTRRKRSIQDGTNVNVIRKLQIKDSKPIGNAAGLSRNSWLLVFILHFFCTYV